MRRQRAATEPLAAGGAPARDDPAAKERRQRRASRWQRAARRLLLCAAAALVLFVAWRAAGGRTKQRRAAPLPELRGGTGSEAARGWPARGRIPRVLHQTGAAPSAAQLAPRLAALRASWAAHNPLAELRYYNDEAASAALEEAVSAGRLPARLAKAYSALEVPVERADLFRYLIVWLEVRLMRVLQRAEAAAAAIERAGRVRPNSL